MTEMEKVSDGTPGSQSHALNSLSLKDLALWMGISAASFHTAYAFPHASGLMALYLFGLIQLARANTWRKAFYPGLIVGLLIASVRLAFFWSIFSGGAIGLWLVFSFWLGLFVALTRLFLLRFGPKWGWLLIPFLWTGLEYFRSELYFLRFSWLNPGYAFAQSPWHGLLNHAGMYGTGFLLMLIACAAGAIWKHSKSKSLLILAVDTAAICLLGMLAPGGNSPVQNSVHIAGIQMEVPAEDEVIFNLGKLIRKFPDTELIVLSEYTFHDPVPPKVLQWCNKNRRFLVVGGQDPAPNNNYFNTAFVVGTNGDIVFRQVKSVPIQFFKDGLPATKQKLWDSPWGKIGFCICYDLSYTRVTDRLVQLGAQAIIVPTMDVADWGEDQHRLHARVAPTRASEYGIPLFRVASSGISQWIDHSGVERASCPFPGDGAMLAGAVEIRSAGRLPFDRWLAPFSTGLTGAFLVGCLIRHPRKTEVTSAPSA